MSFASFFFFLFSLPVFSFVKADEVDKSTPYFVYRDILSDIFDLSIISFQMELERKPEDTPTGDRPRELKGTRMNSSPNLQKEGSAYSQKFSGTIGRSQSMHGPNSGTGFEPSYYYILF